METHDHLTPICNIVIILLEMQKTEEQNTGKTYKILVDLPMKQAQLATSLVLGDFIEKTNLLI